MLKNDIVLIPAYKPTPFLLELIRRLKDFGFLIILVDDGSGAAYKGLFSECSRYAKILCHTENSGKGCALKTGLSYIYKTYGVNCVTVTMDADGQHRVEDALAVLKTAGQNPDTLVLGSRKLKENVPARSRFGNTITRFVYGCSTGLKVHDTQTGLRAFTGALIPRLLCVPGKRYEYEMNMLLHFARDNIKIMEHEIETVYIDNNSQSHFDTVKDSARIYKEILKFSASSFISFLVDYLAYSLLLLLTDRLSFSNVAARIISAAVNFTLNRKFVFQSKEQLLKAAGKYFLLAAAILFGNTLVLSLLVNICCIHRMLAKIITEILFFSFSWLVQRLVIFRKRAGGDH